MNFYNKVIKINLSLIIFFSLIMNNYFLYGKDNNDKKTLNKKNRISIDELKPISEKPKNDNTIQLKVESYHKIEPKIKVEKIEKSEINLLQLETKKNICEFKGSYGESIIFAYSRITKPLQSNENIYSVGDHLALDGILKYDYETKLNYLDIIKINREELYTSIYIKVYFKSQTTPLLEKFYQVSGTVLKNFSNDRVYLDDYYLTETFVDKSSIIEICSDSIIENLYNIENELKENEELKNWLQNGYGLSNLDEDFFYDAVNNSNSIRFNFDFFDQIAKCTFNSTSKRINNDSEVVLVLECLYDNNLNKVEKIIISLNKFILK